MLSLLKALFGGDLKFKQVASQAWEVWGEPKVLEKAKRRAERGFMAHLKKKHENWVSEPDYLIAIPDDVPPLVAFFGLFYAMRCAVKGSRCKHKGS